jgi:Zn-dependent oligopeptidase
MRLDVFKAKAAAEKNLRASGAWEKLSEEQQRLVEKMVLDGKRAGLALPEKEREELMKLKKELSQACLDFSVRVISSVVGRGTNSVRRKTSMKRMWERLFISMHDISIHLSNIGLHLIHARRARWCPS